MWVQEQGGKQLPCTQTKPIVNFYVKMHQKELAFADSRSCRRGGTQTSC